MRKLKWVAGLLVITVACSLTLLQPLAALADTTTAATPTAPVATNSSATNTTLRLAGQDRYETAAKIAEAGWKTTSDYAVLAAGMDQNLVDALTAAPLAKAKNAPILLTQGDSLNSYAKAELQRLQVKTVYVTSGPGVIQKAVTDSIAAMGITVKSLGGSDRFATAVNIATELGSLQSFSQAVVATAYSNADALSVASIAATEGMPILLTNANSLPDATASYINSLKSSLKSTYVIGGTGAVSDSVKALLPDAQRIGGVDRFDTNRLVLKAFAPQLGYGTVYVANGGDDHLIDALAAAPLAALTGSPVVLSDVQLPAETLTFAKSALLPRTVVALGGEGVVSGASLNALTSATQYTTAGATEGSSDPANKSTLADSVLISADNVTLQNAIAPFSIYVSGNNVTLTNLQVTGTVFLDPGATGSATLNNVSAAGIVVLSGATSSIHLNNVTADNLTVDSSSNVHIQTSGNTTVTTTYVSSSAILDASSGNLGSVIIIRATEGGTVELRGTFSQPIIVEGAATIVAAPGASIAQLTIAPTTAGAQVNLSGNFAAVNVTAQANVALAAGSVVTSMTTTAQANIQVPPTASVVSLTDQGNTGTLVSGGGTVNGQTTTDTPSAPPSGGTTPPPVTPPEGGGTVSTASITAFSVSATPSGSITGTISNGVSGTVDLSNATTYPNTVLISGVALSAPSGSSLTITQISSGNTGVVTLSKSLSSVSSITLSELLGNLISNGNVSLGSMRGLFGSQVTFTGTLACANYTSSTVTLTINLGSTSGIVNNNYATMSVSGNTITATIKPGMSSSLLSSMGLYSLLNMVGQVPSYVTTNSAAWSSSTYGGNPATSQGRADIQNAIATLSGAGSWSTATLGQLSGKSIYFKKLGDATTVYTLTIQ